MAQGKRWTREELIPVIVLYCRTTFGRLHSRNPDIIALAEQLGRTPGSLAMKMTNFASLDEGLDRKGLGNCSSLDKAVWKEFYQDWDRLADAAEALQPSNPAEGKEQATESGVFPEGRDILTITKRRSHQRFFSETIRAAYDHRCTITGINTPSLLIASHIVPWSKGEKSRTDPHNGLCLNALHDKAFDRGLITLDDQYRVVLSNELSHSDVAANDAFFQSYTGQKITLPRRFRPSQTFLQYHRDNIFAG